jgi:hypothetical protein
VTFFHGGGGGREGIAGTGTSLLIVVVNAASKRSVHQSIRSTLDSESCITGEMKGDILSVTWSKQWL